MAKLAQKVDFLKTDNCHIQVQQILIFLNSFKFIIMQYLIPFVNWTNGAIMMTVIFGLVIVGLVGFVVYFINTAERKEKKEDEI